MSEKTYCKTVAIIFSVIGLFHLLRAISGWEAILGDVVVPIWASWAAVLIAGYLALRGFALAKK